MGKKRRLQTILYFLKGSMHFFALCILFSLLVAVLDLINPKIVQYTVDVLLGDEGEIPRYVAAVIAAAGGREFLRAHLYVVALAVVLIALCGAVCRYLYRVYNAKGAERLIKRMRDLLFAHILYLPFSWHGKNHTGDIIQRCTSDVETVKNFLADQLTNLIRVVILIVVAIYFMAGIDGQMTLIAIAMVPVVVLYSIFFHNRIASTFARADIEEGKLSAIAQENLTGVRVVRAFGREKYERDRFETQNHGYTLMWIRLMGLLSAFWCSNDLIYGLQVLLVTAVGAVFCVHGKITVGAYIAFVSYNGMLTWPVRDLGRVISDMSKAGISIDRIAYIMDAQEERETDEKTVSAVLPESSEPQDIVFSHVSFAYGQTLPKVLDDVSFTIKKGTTFGILGSTGSGKSTMMYLLERLYDLPEDSGSITIGGTDIRAWDRQALRRFAGLVQQEPYLFSRTLAENIAITDETPFGITPDMERVREAAHTAALDETVLRFADGYETFVGERGVTLSGGQKQRTAIAQILLEKPPVMIFDDALSAVDMETDAIIRRRLTETAAGATVILISHRITTLQHADQIIVLSDGQITERGTHEELLSQNGIYRQIYEIQMQAGEN